MRKIIVTEFISLDGVIQAPGGKEEDLSGGFKHGGWVAPYGDETFGKVMEKQMAPADLLLGRKTFEIFENYWPQNAERWPGVNDVTKFVYSNTRNTSHWSNVTFVNSVQSLHAIKNADGGDIKVWGSAELAQLLFQNDLVDELWLKIYPITLGKGKNLYAGGTIPLAFKLYEHVVTPSGVIAAYYRREGEVRRANIDDREQ